MGGRAATVAAVVAAFAGGFVVARVLERRARARAALQELEAPGQSAGQAALRGEAEIVEEQLSRGAQFLGDEGQAKLAGSFVIVVGAGGVGSHCAHFLARSGVRKLRVIDFDNVTLSSLNRHAVAGREDVGTPKVASLAKHIARFAPFCEVEARAEMFTGERAEVLLGGQPDFVVDCIDDRTTKAALLGFCVLRGLRVLSSMAAGAKADPTRVHIAQFREVIRDPLASRLRWNVKQFLKEYQSENVATAFERIEVIYSSEQPHMKLLPLDAEVAGEDPSSLGTVPDFRVRVMPVLGTMPAIFGMAMAARVVTELAEHPFAPVPAPALKQSAMHKYRQRLGQRLTKLCKAREEARGEGASAENETPWNLDQISDDDVAVVVAQFCQRCPITQQRMGAGSAFSLTLWRYDRPVTPNNLVVCSGKALEKLEALVLAKKLPTPRELGISPEDFAQIVATQCAVMTPRQLRREQETEPAFAKGAVRAVSHMNKDHAADCVTLVQNLSEVGEVASAELLHLDRMGMTFRCKRDGGAPDVVTRVVWPSRLLEPTEMRETVTKMTLQARKNQMK